MPTREESWRLAEAARARIRAEHPRSDRPRIKVRIDPIIRRSLLALAAGLALILASIVLAPPA
jgi:hypothetical protein